LRDKITAKEVPNVADVYALCRQRQDRGVSIFTSAIGLGFRTDKGLAKPTSWKESRRSQARRRARQLHHSRSNSLGQCHLMMLGRIYGKGLTDLDAAYKALEQLKPIKLVDFTGQMEKLLLSGEVRWPSSTIRVSTVTTARTPVDFAGPSEGVLALEQVLNVTPGFKVKELAFAYIDYMLRPDVQKLLAEGVVVFAGQQEGEARRQVPTPNC